MSNPGKPSAKKMVFMIPLVCPSLCRWISKCSNALRFTNGISILGSKREHGHSLLLERGHAICPGR